MKERKFIEISEKSRIPKYRQIYTAVKEGVRNKNLEVGMRIPSINELSEQVYISRDTVEKAYNLLKNEGIIESKKGRGFFISSGVKTKVKKVLFLLNKFSDYKLKVYRAFLASLGSTAKVDFYVYHCDSELFINKINENITQYDWYVIMPHFKDKNNASRYELVKKTILQIPPDKLVIMDNRLEDIESLEKVVYQDFKMDIYHALMDGKDLLKKYGKLILIFPNNVLYPHPQEIKIGFRKFCSEEGFDFEIIDGGEDNFTMEVGDVFIAVEEKDLVSIISQAKKRHLQVGRELGIISYNDTPLKKFLEITVISTDFKAMGGVAAALIDTNKTACIKNEFHFINRGSV